MQGERGRTAPVRVGIAVRPRVYVPARELISREPLCLLTDQTTTTGHYAPATHVGYMCVRLSRSRERIKANLHGMIFHGHQVDVLPSEKN